MIVISDLHLKAKQPYWKYQQEFLQWCTDNFQQETLVFLGDIFDTSSPTWEVFSHFQKFLIQWAETKNDVFILHGNHEYSRLKGSALEPLKDLDDVHIIDKPETRTIDNLECLLLPYQQDMKSQYEILEGTYDYVLTHITPIEEQFHGEGIDLKVKAKTIIHGHIHTHSHYVNSQGVRTIIPGVPLPTRHGEIGNPIMRITDLEQSEYIEVPAYFSYETVTYGEEPVSKNNILNIIDAPDVTSVRRKYEDCYIREQGIALKRPEGLLNLDNPTVSGHVPMIDQFRHLAKEQDLASAVTTVCLDYLVK